MNLFKKLKSILPDPPLLVGNVAAVSNGTATITLPDGTQVQARGDVSVGDRVFFRGGVVEGPAPTLSIELIEI